MGGMAAAGAGVGTFGTMLSTAGQYLNRPKKIQAPPFTPQEQRYLQQSQQLGNEGRGMLEGGASQYGLSTPSMYQLAGYDPTYLDNSQALGAATAKYNSAQQAYMDAQDALRQAKQGKAGQKAIKAAQKTLNQAKQDAFAAQREVGYYRANPTQITGVQRNAEQQAQDQMSNQLVDSYQRRVADAMAGKTPDDPALVQRLTDQERQLHQSLLDKLGPDYALSTAGQNALAQFDNYKNQTLYAARQQEIGNFARLTNTSQTTMGSLATQRIGNLRGIAQGAVGMGGALYGAANESQQLMLPYTQQRLLKAQYDFRNAQVPSDWAAGLMYSGAGHERAGQYLMSASSQMQSSQPDQSNMIRAENVPGGYASGGNFSQFGPYASGYAGPGQQANWFVG